jgi:two-component system NtrC family sensor kinase
MPQTRRVSALRLLTAMAIASVAVPAGLFAYSAWQENIAIHRGTDERIGRYLDVLQEQTVKVIQSIELAVVNAEEILRDLPDEQIRTHQPTLSPRLRAVVERLSQVQSIWVFDAQGRPLVSSSTMPVPPTVDNSERDYFRAHVPADAGTFIGEVVMPRIGDGPIFTVSRRRSSSTGQFRGVVAAAIRRQDISTFYERLARSADVQFGLMRRDGVFLVRHPEPPGGIARLSSDSTFFREISASPSGVLFTSVGQIDGVARRIGTRKIDRYPIYATAGVTVAAMRAEWLRWILGHMLVGVPATAVLFLISWIALRQTRRMYAEADRRMEAELALRQAQKMEAVGQLTGGVAHDFNNLLAALLGNLELLRKRLPQDPQMLRFLDHAVQAAERGAALTGRMLAFARRQELTPEPVDIPKLVRGIGDLLTRTIGAAYQIETRFPVQLPPALVDANQLELAILNLVVNARDAMPEGGAIVIGAREEALEEGNTRGLPAGTYVRLSVQDHGSGMDEATLARASEPFFTTKGVGRGTGLGLSMVHGLAEQSGGRLVLQSRLGEGTVVEIWLPRTEQRRQPAPAAEPPPPRDDAPGEKLLVLVVDDDPLVLAGTAGMLEDLGHEAREARSGQEALAQLEADARGPDLLVADQVMPGMSGVELIKEVHRRWPWMPTILASGFAERPADEHVADVRLKKPFSQDMLREALAACRRARKNVRPLTALKSPRSRG